MSVNFRCGCSFQHSSGYVVVGCDICKSLLEIDNTDLVPRYRSYMNILENISSLGWTRLSNGSLVCPDCRRKLYEEQHQKT